MKNKYLLGGIAAAIVILVIGGVLYLRSGNDAPERQAMKEPVKVSDLVDKTQLQQSANHVMNRLTYCKRALEQTEAGTAGQEGFDELWSGVNEIRAKAYAARMVQADLDEAMASLQTYKTQVDKLYKQNKAAIKKLKKQDKKDAAQKAKSEKKNEKKNEKKKTS